MRFDPILLFHLRFPFLFRGLSASGPVRLKSSRAREGLRKSLAAEQAKYAVTVRGGD